MKQNNDRPYLQHIMDAIERIEQYTQGSDESSFGANGLVQDGVIRQLMVIGEAVKLLSDELRSTYPSILWRRIARMRDRLVHHYFGIDIQTVWLTAQEDMPVLKQAIKEILSARPGDG